ncbi:dipeptide ABC transporter ATP-binding protein [Arthrobacter roseus]|uniref:dipeptide ABC transporter ATP-binding protein n=1 Tax=Arthrobacter roseus TaxID=136274 RepID=UPI001962C39A|nr:ABC transporter ATP-binding protein [Arthrobacter roseus]MBM7848713.1 peptide/nickel transport system ATP-binding protein [Arthrobacter roseus]
MGTFRREAYDGGNPGSVPRTGQDVLLRVDDLTVGFGAGPVVSDVSFSIGAGQCLALVGESGSGKSVTARALMGLAGDTAEVSAGSMTLAGRSLKDLSPRQWRSVRGQEIGFVLQDALVSLDPLRTVGREIDDALRLRTNLSRNDRQARVLKLLHDVGMDHPALRAGQRSGQLSGGLRQRALIASAIALNPALLIADEPTTALDATVQAQVLELLESLRDAGTGLLLISHDLAVVSRIAQQVAVMSGGRIVEQGPTAAVLGDPQHEYTKQLLKAVPSGHPRGTRLSAERLHVHDRAGAPEADSDAGSGHGTGSDAGCGLEPDGRTSAALAVRWDGIRAGEPVLEARNLSKKFSTSNDPFTAVDNVSFTLSAGSTLGLVGESGSGKTTVARMTLGLAVPDAGDVRLFGEPWSGISERERRRRRPLVGAVYQDPLSSFDPRMTVEQILIDAASGGKTVRAGARRNETGRLLDMVGLPGTVASRGPRNLSGGQRQRVAIARALAPEPRIVICDEPASSLDVSIQAQVLDLLDELQREFGLSYLFISHDLGVVRHMSDHVAVMQRGRIVEQAGSEQIFTAPEHPYTRRLLEASPRLETS